MDARQAMQAYAGGRLVLGVGLLTLPAPMLRIWTGRDGDRAGAQVLARAMGARDIGLAAGTLLAPRRGDSAKPWLLAGALSDAVDLVATWTARESLPRVGGRLVGLMAVGGTLTGLTLACVEE